LADLVGDFENTGGFENTYIEGTWQSRCDIYSGRTGEDSWGFVRV